METNIGNTTITDMTNVVKDYSVTAQNTDGVSEQKETEWTFQNWSQNLGYYKKIPELQKAIGALAVWSVGKGFTANIRTSVLLENIKGWGEDTFESIMWNLLVTKKICGDAFAEVIRNKETGTLINLKPLDPGSMKVVVDEKGIIKRYEQITKGQTPNKRFEPSKIFHISNDRIADEIHGTSVIDACEWVILARNEAMNDWKRISHRSTIRVMYIDADNATRLSQVKAEYAEAIKKGELMIIPAKPNEAEIRDLVLPPIDAFIRWIQYLENFFYQAVGVPRVIATSENYTEAASKVGFLTFEPVYTWEQVQLEKDLWNQLAIKLKFNRPPSLGGDLSRDQAKDGQAFQPNDTQAGAGQ